MRVAVALFIFPILILDLTLGVVFKLNDLFARPLENVLLDTIVTRIVRMLKFLWASQQLIIMKE